MTNIIRFNWHFYVLAAMLIVMCWILNAVLGGRFMLHAAVLTGIIVVPILISLLVSCYVYDLSGLYTMPWLSGIQLKPGASIVNINAGLDEFSALIKNRFPQTSLEVLDFYDAKRHTEVSIKRARKRYPPYPGTTAVGTTKLPLPENSADLILVTLAAHEIRNEQERTLFFQELARVVKPDGRILVTEHLRDLPNFLAYTIGFFHFLPRASWYRVFLNTHLEIVQRAKSTPFITTFMLRKNGTAS